MFEKIRIIITAISNNLLIHFIVQFICIWKIEKLPSHFIENQQQFTIYSLQFTTPSKPGSQMFYK